VTEVEASKLVAVIVNAYPGTMARFDADQQKQTQAIYRRMLLDLDAKSAAGAVQRLLADSRFMPSVAEIRRAVVEYERGPMRPAGDAWGDVLAAIRKFGSHRTPQFADPMVASAVASMGWYQLCSSESPVADRARFIELYENIHATARREAQMPAAVRRELPVRSGGPYAMPSLIEGVLDQAAKLLPNAGAADQVEAVGCESQPNGQEGR
jgi:hypothetical protein